MRVQGSQSWNTETGISSSSSFPGSSSVCRSRASVSCFAVGKGARGEGHGICCTIFSLAWGMGLPTGLGTHCHTPTCVLCVAQWPEMVCPSCPMRSWTKWFLLTRGWEPTKGTPRPSKSPFQGCSCTQNQTSWRSGWVWATSYERQGLGLPCYEISPFLPEILPFFSCIFTGFPTWLSLAATSITS